MAKHITNKIVRFVSITDLSGKINNDWHDEYLGMEGMLCIYESEHKAPGKKFIYFYPNEPESDLQRYFNSISGELRESGNRIFLETDQRYEFEVGDFLSEDEQKMLWLNVLMN